MDLIAMSRAHQTPIRVAALKRSLAIGLQAVLGAAALLAVPTAAQAALSPTTYRADRLCGVPLPGYAGCFGLRLVAKHPASRPQIETKKPAAGSLSPGEVLRAYSLLGLAPPANKQTLALVDAYDDPTIEHDLEIFDKQYGLLPCTTANKCFTKVVMHSAGKPAPTDAGWAQEISTDVELAHGLCPECKIALVEAYSNKNEDLEAAEREAESLGATEISNSWGGPELGITVNEDEHDAFNDPGVVITASAGDEGYLDWGAEVEAERGYADYPASSPHVVAVGGTRLSLSAGGAWHEETVWNGDGAGGGGCSTVLEAPSWQKNVLDWPLVGCGEHRAVADVSADADPYTGVSVYDSTPVIEEGKEYSGWSVIGGTSVASPIIAATYALAGGAGKEPNGETVKYPAQTLYENLAFEPLRLHDVTSGSNGECTRGFESTGVSRCNTVEEGKSCSQNVICVAHTGYDGPSGVGTPDGIEAFKPLSKADREKAEENLANEKAEEAARKKAEAERTEKEAQALKEAEEKERAEREATQRRKEQEAEEQALKVKASEEQRIAEERRAAEELEAAAEKFASEMRALESVRGAGTGSTATTPEDTTPSVVLSDLALTRGAKAALAHGRPAASRLAFTFTLNLATRVRVTVARQIVVHGHGRWQTLPYSLTISAAKGHDSARLSVRSHLGPGSYRLTLTPAHGTSQSLTFPIG